MDYLSAACARLGVSPDQVLVCRMDGDDLVVVVDRGVAGCPKYRLPLATLEPIAEEAPEWVTATKPTTLSAASSKTDPAPAPKPKPRGRRKRNG